MRQATLLNTSNCRIEAHSEGYALHTPYNPGFVNALKGTIPATDRKWDKAANAWIVSLNYGTRAQLLIEQHYGVTVILPAAKANGPQVTMQIIDLRYLGVTKLREDMSETAFGWTNGGWNVIFPKAVLVSWFEGAESRPGEAHTLYSVLTVSQEATPEEIKKAYRRLARQWHPDVCKEPDAREQFEAIQQAYEVLSSDKLRARYNAGLQLEASMDSPRNSPHKVIPDGYRSPLRCGLVMAKGTSRLGRFVVEEILSWQDITNSRGQVLVTSWQKGQDTFTESWVEA